MIEEWVAMKSLKRERGTGNGEHAGCGEPVLAAVHADPDRLVADVPRSPFPVSGFRARSGQA